MDSTTRILVVDDDELLRRAYARFLGKVPGRDIRAAADNGAALRAIHSWTPHLITSDFNRAGGTGDDFLRALRDIPALRGVPVLIISGLAEMTVAHGVLSLGAAGVLKKPIDAEDLRHAVATVLAGGRLEPPTFLCDRR